MMERRRVAVIISNFYQTVRDGPLHHLLHPDMTSAWLSSTPDQCCVVTRQQDERRAVLPYEPVIKWIDLMAEADQRNASQAYRSFADPMERSVWAMINPRRTK